MKHTKNSTSGTRHVLPMLLLLCLMIRAFPAQSQDQIMTMSGKIMDVHITDDSGANVFFDVKKKKGKTRNIPLFKGEVFSLTEEGAPETVLYAQDLDFGYTLTELDMRHLIYGQHDARNGYNATPSMIGGFVVGLGASLYTEAVLIPLVVPFVYSLSMQIPYIKIREKSISHHSYTLNEHYVVGYNKTARSKKMFRSFLGSAVGVVLGIGIVQLSQ